MAFADINLGCGLSDSQPLAAANEENAFADGDNLLKRAEKVFTPGSTAYD